MLGFRFSTLDVRLLLQREARPGTAQAGRRPPIAAAKAPVERREVAEPRGKSDVADPVLPSRGIEQHGRGALEPFARDVRREAEAAALEQQID